MISLHALVDYYNIANFSSSREPDYESHLDAIDKIVEIVTKLATELIPAPTEIKLRLYGGWHDATTNTTTLARDIIGKITRKYFPTRKTFRIFVEASDSLYCQPEFPLSHTVRKWYGFVPFRIEFALDNCNDKSPNCPLYALELWRKGRCPNQPICQVKSSESIVSVRQKLVDTSIVADTIFLASQTDDWVVSISNDDDIIPGVLTASKLSGRAKLVRVDRKKASPYDMFFFDTSILIQY